MAYQTTIRDNVSVVGDMAATSATVGPYLHRAQSAARQTVQANLSGSWVGTVDLEVSVPGQDSWTSIATHTSNTSFVVTFGGSMDVRWKFTSRVSGTVKAGIIND